MSTKPGEVIAVRVFAAVRRVFAHRVDTDLPLFNACVEFRVFVAMHIAFCPGGIALIESLLFLSLGSAGFQVLLVALVAGFQGGLEKM